MTALPEDMSVAIDELESAIAEMESRLETTRAERDERRRARSSSRSRTPTLRRELTLARAGEDTRASEAREQLAAPPKSSRSSPARRRTCSRYSTPSPSSAAKLFGARAATISDADGRRMLHFDATTSSPSPAMISRRSARASSRLRSIRTAHLRPRAVTRNRQYRHIPDLDMLIPRCAANWPAQRCGAGGLRSITYVPLLDQGQGYRHDHAVPDRQPGFSFSERQRALPQTFRRSGRDRDRERAAVQRDAGGAGAADRDRRHPEGDRRLAVGRQPVFDSHRRECQAAVRRLTDHRAALRGDSCHLGAFTPTNPEADEGRRRRFRNPWPNSPASALVRDGEPSTSPTPRPTTCTRR